MKTKITETGGATARPWKITEAKYSEGKRIVFGTDERNVAVANWKPDETDRKNIALIVQAVNQFDALNAVASALEKLWAFYNDLADSNPGFIGKLALQDYKQWTEAMIETPTALAQLSALKEAK